MTSARQVTANPWLVGEGSSRCFWSGGGLEGDVVAECLELVHEVAGLAVAVDAAGVVVGTQVVEPCGGVGE